MNKLKKSNGIFYVVISLVAVLAIGGLISAYSGGSPKVVIENGNYIEAGQPAEQPFVYPEQPVQYDENGEIIDENLGGTSATTHTQAERFLKGFGGAVLATSTSGTTTTLSEKDLNKYTVIEMTPNVASFTYTLPATSTLISILKNAGDTRTWVFQNATTTTATTLTLATGAGWNLSGVDANVDVIAGAAYTARVSQYLTCYRQSNKDIHCNIDEAIAVD